MCLRVCAPLVRQKKKSEAVGMERRTVLQFRDGGSGNSGGTSKLNIDFLHAKFRFNDGEKHS